MFYVIIAHSFDPDVKVYHFGQEDKAKAFLHWLWEDYYNREIAEQEDNCPLDERRCWHEDTYARVTWENEDYTEFLLGEEISIPKEFEEIDWKRYL